MTEALATITDQLDGLQKSAILLISLGAEASAAVLKTFSDKEVQALAGAISRHQEVPTAIVKTVQEEFGAMMDTMEASAHGGLDYAASILEQALGAKKAKEILESVQGYSGEAPPDTGMMELLKKLEPKTLVEFLNQEHPQTTALILGRMDPPQAAQVLAALKADVQAEVLLRVAEMDVTSPEVIREIEAVLHRRFSGIFSERATVAGGTKSVAEIMNRLDRSTERQIMGMLQDANDDLAETIRAQMFTFDDIVKVDDRGIQRLLKEVEQKDLVLSLKAAGPEITTKIYKNMSERASSLIKEEISFLGPTRLKDVEEAQRRIVEIVRRLEDEGALIVAGRGGEEDVLV